ncbi:MAG: alcohol dehydrogenase [Nitrospinaceae bacterium]|nr:MAG: alcohol dehydrogenase [Nitrospinaceae bacterium]
MTTQTLETSKTQTPEKKVLAKAAVIREFGGPDVFRIEDVEVPERRPGHVLVKVLAAGINRLDHYIREGGIVPTLPFPHILGIDAVGEVEALGDDVTKFSPGERVIVVPGYAQKKEETEVRPTIGASSFALPGLHIAGTYTSYMEVPEHGLIKDDTGFSPEEAATLPVVLSTSVHAVHGIGQVTEGDRVLVRSGASGSGSMLIQVAKALGASVIATVRGDAKAEFVRQSGADLVIDSTREDWVEQVKEWTGGKGVDVVIDNLGGDEMAKSIDAVKAGGVVVAYGFSAGPEVRFDIRNLFFTQKQIRGTMASDIEDLTFGLELVRQGKIRPLLDRVFPLLEAAKAHRLLADNKVRGNLVLLPWSLAN